MAPPTRDPNKIAAYIQSSMRQGQSWDQIVAFWKGNGGNTQQLIEGMQRAGWTQKRIQAVTHYRPSFLQRILGQAGQSIIPIPGPSALVGGALPSAAEAEAAGVGGAGAGAGGAAAGAGGGAAGSAGGAAAGSAGGGFFGRVGGSITETTAFLALIGWIFHPRTWLRIVEFVTGGVLMIFGLWAALQARGERGEGFNTGEAALTRSGLGRVATALGNQARGGSNTRVRSAPHRTRREALRVRYAREQKINRRGGP